MQKRAAASHNMLLDFIASIAAESAWTMTAALADDLPKSL
jgi:hypothetical protein